MGSAIVINKDKGHFLLSDGFPQLIAKLVEIFLPENYQSDIDKYNETLYDQLTSWKVSYVGVDLITFSKRDFNTVVQALEKGRKYLDTLTTEEQEEEFVEDYIGTGYPLDNLKYYVDETLRYCYKDPRYENPNQ
jgi:hypothetical protein